jgi:site-specific DNA-adenine methylase
LRPLTKWSGSKRRFINHYLPYFQETHTFTDLFAGSFIVSQYASRHYPRVVGNDNNQEWIDAVSALQSNPEQVIAYYDTWAARYLEADNPRTFYNDEMRSAYHFDTANPYKKSALLILMLQTNFGGMFLRRQKFGGNYGTAYGKRKAEFPSQVLWDFHKDIRDVEITCRDWTQVPMDGFVFADPPYRSVYQDPNDYDSNINHEALADALKAHGSFAYCGTDLGDGWLDKHFAGYGRVEIETIHTSKRGADKDSVKEVMIYAS